MKMQKLLLTFGLVFFLSGTIFANANSETTETVADSGKTQISFMSPLAGADGSYMDKIIEGFNAANDDVEVVHIVVEASTDYKQKFSTGVSTKSAPEVLLMRKFDMPQYMDQFAKYSKEDYANLGIDITDVYPNLLDGLTVDGKYVGIPLDVWLFYMAYNKANWKAAGLDPEKAPTNSDEFIAQMTALKEVTPDGLTPYYETPTWDWLFAHLLWQFGGDLLTDDFKKPAFQEAGVKALNYMLDLQEKGILPSAAVDAGPAFESGESSTLITGIWTINTWKNMFGEDFGYAVAPQLGDTNAVFGGSHVIALTDVMLEDPTKKAAAEKWVSYLWDHMIDWYGAGQTPSRISIAEGEELKTTLPHIYAVSQTQDYIKSFQMFPYISEVLSELVVYLEAVLLTGDMTPEDALTEAADSVQYILDDYWAEQK